MLAPVCLVELLIQAGSAWHHSSITLVEIIHIDPPHLYMDMKFLISQLNDIYVKVQIFLTSHFTALSFNKILIFFTNGSSWLSSHSFDNLVLDLCSLVVGHDWRMRDWSCCWRVHATLSAAAVSDVTHCFHEKLKSVNTNHRLQNFRILAELVL